MNFKDAYYPTKGVKTDFSNLLEKFSERESVRYQHFAEVWRSMKFSYLCAARKSEGECREFFEEVNHIALSFYLPPYNFQVRVGGLYILYGLYVTQPCSPKVPIRVTLDQWKQILEFQENADKQKHLDVEFVFQKLYCERVFQFVATPQEVYIKAKDMARHEKGSDGETALNNKLKEVAVSVPKVLTPEIMQQLNAIHTQYQHLKLGIAGPNALRPDRSLDVIEDEIITNIEGCMQQHKLKLEKIRDSQKKSGSRKREQTSDSEEEEDDTEADDPNFTPAPKSAQARVKAQAYSQKAKQTKSRRHRTVITQDASASSPEKVSRKTERKKKKRKGHVTEDTKEENSENFLSSSMEESSEHVMSPMDYLSMPTLDGEDESTHHTGTVKSKKSIVKTKSQTTQKQKKDTTKSTSVKKTPKKAKVPAISERDTDIDKSKEPAQKKPTKGRTKTKSTPTKVKPTPTKVKSTPTKVKSTPTKGKSKSPKGKSSLSKVMSSPTMVKPTKTKSSPSKLKVKIKSSPSKTKSSPTKLKVKINPSPAKSDTKMTALKPKAQTSPEQKTEKDVKGKRKLSKESEVEEEPETKVKKTSPKSIDSDHCKSVTQPMTPKSTPSKISVLVMTPPQLSPPKCSTSKISVSFVKPSEISAKDVSPSESGNTKTKSKKTGSSKILYKPL